VRVQYNLKNVSVFLNDSFRVNVCDADNKEVNFFANSHLGHEFPETYNFFTENLAGVVIVAELPISGEYHISAR